MKKNTLIPILATFGALLFYRLLPIFSLKLAVLL